VGNAHLIKGLIQARKDAWDQAKYILDGAALAKRELTAEEQKEYTRFSKELNALTERIRELEGLDAKAKDLGEQREQFRQSLYGGSGAEDPNPLAFSPAVLDAVQESLDRRTLGRWEARAALATGTFGAGRKWGRNVLEGPRLLHDAAGVPAIRDLGSIFAQHPVTTIPAAGASVAENVTLAEYATVTAGSVTAARYGKWTDISKESRIGTDAGALLGIHAVSIARDLDKALIDAVNTAAGSAVAFTADVPAAIRKAQAQVADNTASSSGELVILAHPDNSALLQNVTPVGGETIGERFQDFAGSLVYNSASVPTGFMLVANLRKGALYFEAQGLTVENHADVKTGTFTVASSVIANYGLTLNGGTSGAYIKVDVVTP
jgi:hypothetical protein